MPRLPAEEQSFGSDSFLDIVANIVGILIILIVVAGVRVARSPAPVLQSDDVTAAEPVIAETEAIVEEAPVPIVSEPVPSPEIVSEPRVVETVAAPPEASPEPLPEVLPPPELVAEAERLQAANDQLAEAENTLRQQLTSAQSGVSQNQKRLQQLQAQLSASQQQVSQTQNQVAATQADLQAQQARLELLRQQIQAAETEPPPVEELTHQLPPTGRVVAGEELHFSLSRGRVSHVPLDELLRMLKSDINRHKEVLLRQTSYEGRVGPAEEYRLDYVIRRENMSLAEELQMGRSGFRIGLAGWIIYPSGNIATETAEEALRPGSRFYQLLREQRPTAAITFWVYPDSFALHSELKSFAQSAGFWVASRPLPEGVPIAGSPSGSQSVAR